MTRVASFCIMRDEPLFEPLWREYYGKVGDVIVFDPRKTPGLPLELGSKESEEKQCAFVTATFEHLFSAGYDVVMCPDADEFLIPSNGQSLREFCETFDGDYAKANGYNVVHLRHSEPPVDFVDPLANRGACFASDTYSKVILTRKPLTYGVGRHYAFDQGRQIAIENPDLDLVHLKFIDFELDYARWIQRAKRCPGMNQFSREQFGKLYDTGIDPVAGWVYWEWPLLQPKSHWRDAIRLSEPCAALTYRCQMPDVLRRIHAKRICEVGVRHGDHLRELLIPEVEEAVAVDIWRETGQRSENDECYSQEELDAQCNAVRSLDRRIVIDRNPSIEAAQHYPSEYFDFVYLDADHTEAAVRIDLNMWWPRVRRGGVLAGHDFYDVETTTKDGVRLRFGVVQAVKEFVAARRLNLYLDQEGDWYIRK